MQSKTLLTGATGRLGGHLQESLAETGHDLRLASRSPPRAIDGSWIELDLAEGTGLRTALDGVDVVVHAATAPSGDSEAVDVRGTERLVEAADVAGVQHLVYVSIVGVDEIPLSYYEDKLAAERAVEEGPVPSTIVRVTQFHEFVAELLDQLAQFPVWLVPRGFQLQPIAAVDAAAAIAEYASAEPSGRVDPIGGPAVHSARELARTYRATTDRRGLVVGVPIPGTVADGFQSGAATCPDRTVGERRWEQWLAAKRD